MAALLRLLPFPSSSCCCLPFTLTQPKQTSYPLLSLPTRPLSSSRLRHVVRSFKVVIEHDGQSTNLDVDPYETILERALDAGLSVPHDCKLGVCMTCPARLLSGSVEQSDGMLSDDVIDRGYALLCASYPRSDCRIELIPEDELLALQLATAND